MGNVHDLDGASDRIRELWPEDLPGLTKFASFTAEEVGTPKSGLNSDVLNPDGTDVLLPLNEPVDTPDFKSQVSTFLTYMGGEAVQHVAFKVDDVVAEVERMREAGVEFLDAPPADYYERAREVAGGRLSDEQWEDARRLGILVDVETSSVGTGMLMQIFTKPFSSSPVGGGLFFEIIQRVGCGGTNAVGCGGFGKGNFRRLYEGIERREEEEREKAKM